MLGPSPLLNPLGGIRTGDDGNGHGKQNPPHPPKRRHPAAIECAGRERNRPRETELPGGTAQTALSNRSHDSASPKATSSHSGRPRQSKRDLSAEAIGHSLDRVLPSVRGSVSLTVAWSLVSSSVESISVSVALVILMSKEGESTLAAPSILLNSTASTSITGSAEEIRGRNFRSQALCARSCNHGEKFFVKNILSCTQLPIYRDNCSRHGAASCVIPRASSHSTIASTAFCRMGSSCRIRRMLSLVKWESSSSIP